MNKAFSYVVLAVSVVLSFQAFQNAQLKPDTLALSEKAACMGDPACSVTYDQPQEQRADVLRRQYEWKTSQGARLVECKRAAILFGAWSCDARPGGFSRISY